MFCKDGKGASGTEFWQYLQSKYIVVFKQYIDEVFYKEFREGGHERQSQTVIRVLLGNNQ